MRLTTGLLAHVIWALLVPDDALAAEDILLGLSHLQHLAIDSKRMFEQNRDTIDGADCASIQATISTDGTEKVGLLMMTRLSRLRDDDTSTNVSSNDDLPRSNFFKV